MTVDLVGPIDPVSVSAFIDDLRAVEIGSYSMYGPLTYSRY